MTAELAVSFEALEAQAAQLMGYFASHDYERVAPSFIQPASLFLDRIGEAMRSRMYVFTDANGEELCLRPDLTIPVCRLLLERNTTNLPAKFCYNGPAFRIQDGTPDPLRPREFRQSGIELFGQDTQSADIEVLGLTLDAVQDAGLKHFHVKTGHIKIFAALLDAMPIAPRWRERLFRSFWPPRHLDRELNTMSSRRSIHQSLTTQTLPLTERDLFAQLERDGIPFIGSRTPSEILTHLKHRAEDAKEEPLPDRYVQLIKEYMTIQGNFPAVIVHMRKCFRAADIHLDHILDEVNAFSGALQTLAKTIPVMFAADFGRHFEYYTGMVFQVEVQGLGAAGHIAGGGRYDSLIATLSGGARNIPAVGGAIHTERLLAATAKSRS